MKKILSVIAIVGLLSFSVTTNAQTKIGYISVDNVIGLMPEATKIDSLLERYYRDSVKTPKAVRDEIAKKLPSYIYQIQNWQQIVNQALEAKQNELLSPLYRKAYDAIKLVAKEKGYTHVMNKEALLVAPDGDDMLKAVAAKLKITIPTNPPPAGK